MSIKILVKTNKLRSEILKGIPRKMIKYNRMVFFLTAFFLMLCFLPLRAQDREFIKETAKYVEDGKELYENKNYYEAVEVLTKVLERDPWNDEAKILLEKALEQIENLIGRLTEGFDFLDKGDIDGAYEKFLYVPAAFLHKPRRTNRAAQSGAQVGNG